MRFDCAVERHGWEEDNCECGEDSFFFSFKFVNVMIVTTKNHCYLSFPNDVKFAMIEESFGSFSKT